VYAGIGWTGSRYPKQVPERVPETVPDGVQNRVFGIPRY